jgi:hypothetical protein
MNAMNEDFLRSAKRQFNYYKSLGDKTFEQLEEIDFYFRPNEDSNSVAIIIRHLYGNMLSRWTDFLTSDGEKPNRNRDQEFEEQNLSKKELIDLWNKGWECLLSTLDSLAPGDLSRTIYIRAEAHTALEAINRQLAHYPYHVGQIVFIGKWIRSENWKSLSIPKNGSKEFNAGKFGTR